VACRTPDWITAETVIFDGELTSDNQCLASGQLPGRLDGKYRIGVDYKHREDMKKRTCYAAQGGQMSAELDLIIRAIATTAVDNEEYFSELDAVVGDGDFGYSLARGFEKVLDQWDRMDRAIPGLFLRQVASVIVSTVGGVSGTIWGTAFLRAGLEIEEKTDIKWADGLSMLRAAVESIKKRGNCDLGDKTYLDALVPAVDALEANLNEGGSVPAALREAAYAARKGAEATRTMVARRGRAAYTGERSIGTIDAGAMAVAVIFEALSESWKVQTVDTHEGSWHEEVHE